MESQKEEFSLNPAQKKAVDIDGGAALVVAGAGTGKTRVIVERLLRLIESGVDRSQILALTFTEKAAQEMLDRASERLHESYGVELNLYTFNAFGAEMLSEFAIEIGLSSSQRLIGDNGKVVLLREHLDELGLDYFAPVSRPDGQLATIADYFSRLNQQLVTPERYAAFAATLQADDEETQLERKKHTELASAFAAYTKLMRSLNLIDYDDQIYLLIELLERRPNVLKRLWESYPYIMVDEFQDTNPMQSRLIDLLAGKHQNIFVVGDDDQSIYGWRGATLANILEFTKRYPNAKEVTLIDNFRSTQDILDAAWRLIQHNNPDRLEHLNKLDKRLRADRGAGITPKIEHFSRLDAELNWVAEDIARRIRAGEDPGQIAVLARGKNTVNRVHRMLEASGVEHTVAGLSSDLYQQPAVAMLLEALRACVNEHDNVALYHTLTSKLFNGDPRHLSELLGIARARHEPLGNLLSEHENKSLAEAFEMVNSWREQAHAGIRELAYKILSDTGYKDSLFAIAQNDEQAARDAQALGQWFDTLYDFEKVSTLPSATSYIDNLDALRAEGEMLSDDSVNIETDMPAVLTVHKAKGLEWRTVYVVDLTEYSFPLKPRGGGLKVPEELISSSSADDHYHEERRLMYVAATRARDELILTYSQSHNGSTKRKPSRFLSELFGTDPAGIIQSGEKLVGLDSFGGTSKITKPIALPVAMRQNGNLVLTASQADDYLGCPLNFYYKHVLNVPEAPSAATGVGSLFHGLIQEINMAKLEASELPTLDALSKRLEDDWPVTGYSSRAQRNRALKTGLAAFSNLYDRLVNEPVPLAVEKPFQVRIPDSKLILRGRVDAVVPDGNGVQIHDYKTSTSVQTAAKAKSKTTASNQLVMYALAWRIEHDEDPVSVSLDYVQTGQIGIVKKRPDSLDKMQAKLSDAAEAILGGNFPRGNDHEICLHPTDTN
jgi:DNA helicase-2/ATP-dependent DNA helicase PcrA